MLRMIIICGFFTAFFVVVLQAVTKSFPVWAYASAVAALGIFLSLFIWWFRSPRWVKFSLLALIAVLISCFYFISTRFSVLPFGDTYANYGLLKLLLIGGKTSSVYPPSSPSSPAFQFDLYGGWPGIQFVGVAFAEFTGIDAFYTALLLPLAFWLTGLLLLLVFLNRLKSDLGVVCDPFFGAALIITSPYLFVPPMFFYQNLATPLWLGCAYMIYRLGVSSRRDLQLTLLLFGFALVVTHSTTSLIMVLYMFFSSVILIKLSARAKQAKSLVISDKEVRERFNRFKEHFNRARGSQFRLSLVLAMILLTWWLFFSTGIWEQIPPRLGSLWTALSKVQFEPYLFQEYGAHPPTELSPLWGVASLTVRDALTVLSFVIGFLLLVFKVRPVAQTERNARKIIIYSLLFAGSVSLLDIFYIKVAPYREIVMFMPFWVLCTIEAFAFWERFHKRTVTILKTVFVAFLVFAILTGFWGSRYLPLQLYDPGVSPVNAGDHPLDWQNVMVAVGSKIDYQYFNNIVTDEKYVTSLIVPLNSWGKIQVVGFKGVTIDGNIVVFVWRNLNIRQTFIEQALGNQYDSEFNASEVKNALQQEGNLVYNDGATQIWIPG